MLACAILTMAMCVACEEAGGYPFGNPFSGPKTWRSESGVMPAPAGDGLTAPVTPEMVKRVEPRYPPLALRDEVEGHVVARFQIAPDGAPFNIEIKSSAHPIFDAEVKFALRNSRFAAQTPGLPLYAGRWYLQPYTFKMETNAAPPP